MTLAMIDPGELRHRLALEAPVETPDGAGGVTRGYAIVAMLWAAVTPVAASGEVIADALAAKATHRIVIRSGPDVTTRHRLRAGTRVLRIVALRKLPACRACCWNWKAWRSMWTGPPTWRCWRRATAKPPRIACCAHGASPSACAH